MFRTGITNLNQLKNKKLNDLFGKEKNISIKLYNDIKINDTLDQKTYEAYSEIILNRFNTKSNAIKRTYRNRFNAFDLNSISIITEADFTKVKIHDLAISDGRASCFFLENLSKSFKKIEYTGSDIAMHYYLHSKPNKNSYLITDENGVFIEVTHQPFVWNMARKEGKFYFLNNLLKIYFLKKYITFLKKGILTEKKIIDVTDQEFRKLVRSKSSFKLKNYNLFEADKEKFNVIRVMNIIHYGYFNEVQLQLILKNIFNSLEEGGLFIEGSNENAGSEVEGAIYKKNESGFNIFAQPEKKSRITNSIILFNQKIKLS